MQKEIRMENDKLQNIFDNLMTQIDSIRKRNNEKGFKTQARYYAATRRFCQFLAKDFRTEKFANVGGKHLRAYVERLQESGKSPGYIDTELSGIRFYYDRSGGKIRLPDNQQMNLEKRSPKAFDRSFMPKEIGASYAVADKMGRLDVKFGILLCCRCCRNLHCSSPFQKEKSESINNYKILD